MLEVMLPNGSSVDSLKPKTIANIQQEMNLHLLNAEQEDKWTEHTRVPRLSHAQLQLPALLSEVPCSFLATQTQNNNIETILLTILVGQ